MAITTNMVSSQSSKLAREMQRTELLKGLTGMRLTKGGRLVGPLGFSAQEKQHVLGDVFGLKLEEEELGGLEVGDVAQGIDAVGPFDIQVRADADVARLAQERRGQVRRVGLLAVGRDVQVGHQLVVVFGDGVVATATAAEGKLGAAVLERFGAQDSGVQADVDMEILEHLEGGPGHLVWTPGEKLRRAVDLLGLLNNCFQHGTMTR